LAAAYPAADEALAVASVWDALPFSAALYALENVPACPWAEAVL
jgi:hypothetical protein